MTSQEFIERVLEIGYDVHFNDGVCWIEGLPFFYRPVVPFQVIEPNTAKPKTHKALLGYSHYVSDKRNANNCESILLLREERLRSFGMHSLENSTRGKVRKGLRLTDIRRIENIELVIEDMKEIEISKAIRIRTAKPPEYYINKFNKWRDWQIKQFNGDRGKIDYWGSFYNDSLIAYTKVFQIFDTMMINYSASHTDHLNKCPNDALTFSILDHYKELPKCKKVSYGGWDKNRPSLNKFKEKYGFERIDIPVYEKYNFHVIPAVKKVLESNKMINIKHALKSYIERARQ